MCQDNNALLTTAGTACSHPLLPAYCAQAAPPAAADPAAADALLSLHCYHHRSNLRLLPASQQHLQDNGSSNSSSEKQSACT